MLQDVLQKHPLRRAFVHEERTFTYGDLATRVREGAGWLQSLGVRKGDRVVLCTANKRAFLLAHLAAVQAGAITLPLNPRFTREELRFFLSDSGARIAIVEESVRHTLEPIQQELPALRAVISDVAVLDAPKSTFRLAPISAEDPCLIIYSSGTTGWPKGVVHTHGNVASALRALADCWRFTADDVVLNVLPLFHVHGLSFATQMTLMTGGCVLLDEFEPGRTLQRIRDCTVFMAVPTIYYRFLEQPNFRDIARSWTKTRLFTCGSAPIRADVLPELESILGKPVINRYGMTEAFVITSLPLDGPWPYGSVGKALGGVEARVDASPGEVGAVQIRGPNLFREYWNKPDAMKDAFASGWFDTGDLGSLDANGFLTLVGRKNDLIITSGFNVYPQVVERIINECPGVRESAVLGVPDERKGERVVAVVVRDDAALDENRLNAYLSERLVDY
ncbi:MAG TPA: class I adenylate-forming enzyme family protein, partial [Candidatus Cybelea sp.]|nr:class I adenylate-forming enzyme family protein [Candidatus Cybelea sp.]